MDEANGTQTGRTEDSDSGPAGALTLHLLRMFETRADAASVALQTEMQAFSVRLQLRLLAAAALFIAIWGGIVLLAIALPPHLRIPVLSGVVALFVIVAIWAQVAAMHRVASRDVGSMVWFLDGLRLDLEVLARSLGKAREPTSPPAEAAERPNDLAA